MKEILSSRENYEVFYSMTETCIKQPDVNFNHNQVLEMHLQLYRTQITIDIYCCSYCQQYTAASSSTVVYCYCQEYTATANSTIEFYMGTLFFG